MNKTRVKLNKNKGRLYINGRTVLILERTPSRDKIAVLFQNFNISNQ